MNAERILISHESLGDARWFVDTASKYASERIVFDRPIGQNQAIQFPIARAYAEAQAADMMRAQGGGAVRRGAAVRRGREHRQAARVRGGVARGRRPACRRTAASGSRVEYDVERSWREARLQQIAPISTNLILSYVGEHVLGMPRSF